MANTILNFHFDFLHPSLRCTHTIIDEFAFFDVVGVVTDNVRRCCCDYNQAVIADIEDHLNPAMAFNSHKISKYCKNLFEIRRTLK